MRTPENRFGDRAVSRRNLILAAAPLLTSRILRAQEGTTFSAGVNVVNVAALVRDHDGKVIADLNKEDFRLEVAGIEKPITYFSRASDLPLTLALLLDTSGSVSGVLDQEVKASRDFFHHVLRQDRDQAAEVHFDHNVALLQDLTPSLEKLDAGLDKAVAEERPGGGRGQGGGRGNGRGKSGGGGGGNPGGFTGGTKLYDAVFLSANAMHKLPNVVATTKLETGTKALLLITDGDDHGSMKSLSTAIEAAQRADSPVYSILYEDPEEKNRGGGPGGPPGGGGGRGGGRRGGGAPVTVASTRTGKEVMEKISLETGGTFFEVSKKHPLTEIYTRIEDELRNRYSIGFDAEAGVTGYRKIRLTTKKKGLVVSARAGYFAE